MFRDPEYLKWANEETIHVFAYSLDPNASKPEPMVEVERDGQKVEVFKAYPMFTPEEMFSVRGELEKRLKYPETTPWAGVVDPESWKVLAEVRKGTAKEFRAAYEAEQKKRGAAFPRADWLKIRASIQASSDAEFDSAWKKAVVAALSAREAAKAAPIPLKEAVDARLASLSTTAAGQIVDARKGKDAAAREKALAKIRADFAGLSVADEAR